MLKTFKIRRSRFSLAPVHRHELLQFWHRHDHVEKNVRVRPNCNQLLAQLFPFKKRIAWIDSEALSLFQRKPIRIDYLAGLPSAIRAISHAPKGISLR